MDLAVAIIDLCQPVEIVVEVGGWASVIGHRGALANLVVPKGDIRLTHRIIDTSQAIEQVIAVGVSLTRYRIAIRIELLVGDHYVGLIHGVADAAQACPEFIEGPSLRR